MFGRTATTPETSPAEANARTDGQVLLDVREIDEWAAGHAPGAVHLPMSTLHPDRLPAASQVLCICRSGSRSRRVVAALRRVGIDAVDVSGGMGAWQADGLPVVRDDGRPGVVV